MSQDAVTPNPWQALRALTDARIALGRAGVSQPTAPQLAFQAAHAQARDAVHLPLDTTALAGELSARLGVSTQALHSAAADRLTYLQRPDLGRRLDAPSAQALDALHPQPRPTPPSGDAPAAPDGRHRDLVLCVADGLSALAVQRQTLPLLQALLPRLVDLGLWPADPRHAAPVALVRQGRVAVGDEVGERLSARLVLVLIGERPGLSSPDSLGAYLTWMPRVGLTDASRNCVSNIRPAGLPPEAAAQRLAWLLAQAFQRRLSGVALKDESAPVLASPPPAAAATVPTVSPALPPR